MLYFLLLVALLSSGPALQQGGGGIRMKRGLQKGELGTSIPQTPQTLGDQGFYNKQMGVVTIDAGASLFKKLGEDTAEKATKKAKRVEGGEKAKKPKKSKTAAEKKAHKKKEEAKKAAEKEADEKEVASGNCVDHSSRRRSGLTCKQLVGQDLEFRSIMMIAKNSAVGRIGKYGHVRNFCGVPKGPNTESKFKIEAGGNEYAIHFDEARSTCCASCAVAPVDIRFGAKSHSADRFGGLQRPEETKFLQCSRTDCKECTDRRNCWVGYSPGNSHGRSLPGNMRIQVHAGAAFSHYRAVVSAQCPVGERARWVFRPLTQLNGFIMTYINNILWNKIYDGYPDASNKDQVEFPMEKIEMIAGPNKFQVDFHPLDLTKASDCQFALLATKVSVGFEECLGQETCLRIFGDGSAAGFAMRNVNKHQIDCLDGRQMPDLLQAMCDKWLICLRAQSKQDTLIKRLQALLHAAGTKKGAGVSKALVQDTRLGQAQECVSPDIADPESMECECMEQLEKACNGVDEVCFRKQMCSNQGICQEWKDENCDPSLMEVMANRSLLKTNTKATAKDMNNANLDNSLSGKCTSAKRF